MSTDSLIKSITDPTDTRSNLSSVDEIVTSREEPVTFMSRDVPEIKKIGQ